MIFRFHFQLRMTILKLVEKKKRSWKRRLIVIHVVVCSVIHGTVSRNSLPNDPAKKNEGLLLRQLRVLCRSRHFTCKSFLKILKQHWNWDICRSRFESSYVVYVSNFYPAGLILSFYPSSVCTCHAHRTRPAPTYNRDLSAVPVPKDFWVILPWALERILLKTLNR